MQVMTIGSEKFHLIRDEYRKGQDLDIFKADPVSRKLVFGGHPVERMTVKGSVEGIKKLMKQTAEEESQKKARKMKVLDMQEAAATDKANVKGKAKKASLARSRITKPISAPVVHPSAPAEKPPAPSNEDLKRKIVHFLAPRANREGAIEKKFPQYPKDDIINTLNEIAIRQISQPDMWQLTAIGYALFDPDYPDYDAATREMAVQQWNVATNNTGRPGGKGKRKREEEPIVFKVPPPSNVPPPPPPPDTPAASKAKKQRTIAAKKKPAVTTTAAKKPPAREATPPPPVINHSAANHSVANHTKSAPPVVAPKEADRRNGLVVASKEVEKRNAETVAPKEPEKRNGLVAKVNGVAAKGGVSMARGGSKGSVQSRNGKTNRSMSLDSMESNVSANTNDDIDISKMDGAQLEREWNQGLKEQQLLQEEIRSHVAIGKRIEALMADGKDAEVKVVAKELYEKGAQDYLDHLRGLLARHERVQARLIRIKDLPPRPS
ncbi:hypothetical protein HK097_011465 [Rhizophlyctis rosea]|uniref:Uncharacterized protein n=1 Tax=Rhizophlyctis rosea TaxID=64517 RepID=A0AAD5WZW3_9FUNG|nr:hypothetical protein HK097_011465 [Rhizophlyctis rosea]